MTLRTLFIFLAGIIVGCLLMYNCNKTDVQCPPVEVIGTTTDTTHSKIPDVASGTTAPKPVSSYSKSDLKSQQPKPPKETAPSSQTGNEYFYDEIVDTATVVKAFFESHNYDTTYRFPQGDVQVKNTVTENNLQSQQILLSNFKATNITNTVTKEVKVPEEKRVKGYLTFSLQGSKQSLLQAVGIGGMLQFKNDNQLGVSVLVNREVPIPNWPTTPFQLMYAHKISFRKK